MFEGPDQRPSTGLHAVESYNVGPAEGNYRSYQGWVPATGAERILVPVVFFPPRRYTYDVWAPPTQEKLVQESAKALGDSLRTLATKNLTYTHIQPFSGLQQLSDLANSATKKMSDAKIKVRQRVARPNNSGGQGLRPNVIENETENVEQQLKKIISKNAAKDNKSENSNVVRDKTYNRPVERANHQYPTRNLVQQVKVKQSATKSEIIQMETKTSTTEPHIGQYESENMASMPPFLLNAVIDNDAGEGDITALVHGIEVLKKNLRNNLLRIRKMIGIQAPDQGSSNQEKFGTPPCRQR